MADYPAAVTSFTTKVDHVDDVQAADVNNLQNEVVAIETELGTDPAGPATDVKTRLARTLLEAASTNVETLSANKTLTDADLPLQYLAAGGSNRDITLPALAAANHHFVIVNTTSVTYTLTVKTPGAVTLAVIQPGDTAMVVSGGSTGDWKAVSVLPASTTQSGKVELATTAEAGAMTDGERAVSPASLKGLVKKCGGTIGSPQTWYARRPQIIMLYTAVAITIASIKINGNDPTPTSELAGDLKHADDPYTGSFANAAVIDQCDTTNGAFSVSSGMDDPTVPANKFIYFQMDSSPHADWLDYHIEFEYTVD